MRILLLLILSFSSIAFATEDVIDFESKKQEELYRVLVKELRCPKCQNQNIADSNAVVAKDMRVKTVELVKQGKNKQEVVDYMVDRYGQFAHYQPPLNSATVLLWVVPIGFMLLALLLLSRRSKNKEDGISVAPVVEEDDELKALLEEANVDVKQQKGNS